MTNEYNRGMVIKAFENSFTANQSYLTSHITEDELYLITLDFQDKIDDLNFSGLNS